MAKSQSQTDANTRLSRISKLPMVENVETIDSPLGRYAVDIDKKGNGMWFRQRIEDIGATVLLSGSLSTRYYIQFK